MFYLMHNIRFDIDFEKKQIKQLVLLDGPFLWQGCQILNIQNEFKI